MPDLKHSSTGMSSSSKPTSIANFVEFLNTVPPPLTITLVKLSKPVSCVRRIFEIASWKSSWNEGWLMLAAWWAFCLLADFSLRYALPLIAMLFLCLAKRKVKSPTSPTPVTDASLQRVITDLETIHTLTPDFSLAGVSVPPISSILYATIKLYLPYLFLTYFIRLRVLIAIVGSVILSWRAPWARTIRQGLWRSAWVRWSIYKLWSYLSGQPLSPPIHSKSYQGATAATTAPAPANSLRFLFTVHENQRWWMGLDWIAALMPQERPAWSGASSEQPVAPPSVFTLPAPTTVYFERNDGRVKRTATWAWEEEEWRVLVRKEGSHTSRVERPLPAVKSEEAPSGSKLLKAAGMMKDPNAGADHEQNDEPQSQDESEIDEDPFTDADGWIYGDNKWESGSGKAGMGKYTRYRRWTRIAVLSEIVEIVGPGEVGVERGRASTLTNGQANSVSLSGRRYSVDGATNAESERAGLRQRLKLAVSGSSTTS